MNNDRTNLRIIARLWLPLALSFELMMVEGPLVQAMLGRLSDSTTHIAAFGLTMALSLIIESPVIMFLATSIALVHGRESYVALRQFVLLTLGLCTAVTGLMAFTPLFRFVTLEIMHQPMAVVDAAEPGMRIMLLWTAFIGWRRFYQGILIGKGQTRLMTLGTLIRLITTVGAGVAFVAWGKWPGTSAAATVLMLAVGAEAIAVSLLGRGTVRDEVLTVVESGPLAQRTIFIFHLPLAATTLLVLLTIPLTSAVLGRMDRPKELLAAWPVVSGFLLVMRGWGLALQEITVAQARRAELRPALARFSHWVGGVTSAVILAMIVTPIFDLYLQHAIRLDPSHWGDVKTGVAFSVLLPYFTSMGSWARGLLVADKRSSAVYWGMVVNLAVMAALLIAGMAANLPGIPTAAVATSGATVIEYGYLRWADRKQNPAPV